MCVLSFNHLTLIGDTPMPALASAALTLLFITSAIRNDFPELFFLAAFFLVFGLFFLTLDIACALQDRRERDAYRKGIR